MFKVSPIIKNMLLHCEYGDLEFDCASKFDSILTDDGLCFTFNGIHRQFLLRDYKLKLNLFSLFCSKIDFEIFFLL